MVLPENTGVWINSFLDYRHPVVDFSILVIAWHTILARKSHFWLERQQLLQAPTSVSCSCLLSHGFSTRFITTSPWSVANKRGLAVHSPDVHSQNSCQVQARRSDTQNMASVIYQTRPRCDRVTDSETRSTKSSSTFDPSSASISD